MSSFQSQSNEQLLISWRNHRCRDSLNELLDRNVQPIRGMVIRMGVRGTDADDITQETMVRAFRGLDGFQMQANFSTWLYSIAANQVRTFFRRNNKSVRNLPQDIENQNAESLDARMRLSETSKSVDAAINELSEANRMAIVLTAFQGLSAEQAAKVCGCSVNAFYGRIHQARKILSEKLSGVLEQ